MRTVPKRNIALVLASVLVISALMLTVYLTQGHDEQDRAASMILTPSEIGTQWYGADESLLRAGDFKDLSNGSSHCAWVLSNGSLAVHAWLVVFDSPGACAEAFESGNVSYVPVASSVNYTSIALGDGGYVIETNQENSSTGHGYPTLVFRSSSVLCTLFTDPHDWRPWMEDAIRDLAVLQLEKVRQHTDP